MTDTETLIQQITDWAHLHLDANFEFRHYQLEAIVAIVQNVLNDVKAQAMNAPTGSGKSTFLRSLNLLEVPTKGHIFFEGVDITSPKVDIDLHRRKMGMVFQHFNLFPHKTILENITLAPIKLLKKSKEEANAKAMELLEMVGLAEKANAYPSQLSGGQKQRIAIARALASRPSIILADEPTGNLDIKSTKQVLDILKEISTKIVNLY